MTVTVEQFAATRFGSQRLRPDHEMLKRIQKAAGRHQQGQLNFPMPPSEHLCTLTTAQRRELLDFLRSFPDTDSGLATFCSLKHGIFSGKAFDGAVGQAGATQLLLRPLRGR